MGIEHAKRIEMAPGTTRGNRVRISMTSSRPMGPSGSSSRTWSASRATSATRSSFQSATARTKRAISLYRFGPLLQEGGERRLNVAITRARQRMTVVSSFNHRGHATGLPQAGRPTAARLSRVRRVRGQAPRRRHRDERATERVRASSLRRADAPRPQVGRAGRDVAVSDRSRRDASVQAGSVRPRHRV